MPVDFIYDLNACGNISDPKKRFLLRISRKDDSHLFAKVVESGLYYAAKWPDFAADRDWRKSLEPIPGGSLSPCGFLSLAGYDHEAKVWFQVCQGRVPDWSKGEGRNILRYESRDLIHWTGPEVVLPIQADEPKAVRDYVEYMKLDAYRVPGPKTGVWLGQLLIFHSDRSDQQYRMSRPFVVWRKGTTELRLVISRDGGNTFKRVDGRQVWLPHSPEEHGYDRLVFGQYPVRVGDEMWLYYSAWDSDHLVYQFDGSLFYPDQFLRRVRTGRATMRWDGYLSLDAGSQREEVVSKPVIFEGSELVLNVAARSGEVRVELRDETGKPIGGFSALECKPLTGDGVAIPVRWRDGNNLRKLAGKPLRIAFRLRDASLYGYQFR